MLFEGTDTGAGGPSLLRINHQLRSAALVEKNHDIVTSYPSAIPEHHKKTTRAEQIKVHFLGNFEDLLESRKHDINTNGKTFI